MSGNWLMWQIFDIFGIGKYIEKFFCCWKYFLMNQHFLFLVSRPIGCWDLRSRICLSVMQVRVKCSKHFFGNCHRFGHFVQKLTKIGHLAHWNSWNWLAGLFIFLLKNFCLKFVKWRFFFTFFYRKKSKIFIFFHFFSWNMVSIVEG